MSQNKKHKMKRINFGEKIINYHLIHYEINPTRILHYTIVSRQTQAENC